MAQVVVGGGAGVGVFRDSRPVVYAKVNWADEWQYLPFVTCTRCSRDAGPGVGTATLVWRFGQVRRAETRVEETFYPYYLNRAYVKVETFNKWGQFATWVGVVENEQVRPWGNTGVATGEQTFTAYELHHLLDRYTLRGSWVNNGAGAQYIKETLVFNGATTGRRALFANKLAGTGVFFVGANSVLWSDWDILNYVFNNFVNSAYGVSFVGVGEAQSALALNFRRLDISGMTPKGILDRLVDRRRGLGYTVETDGVGTVWVRVFSQLSEAAGVGEVNIPANTDQAVVQFAGYRDVDVSYHFGEVTHYDEVFVEGGNVYTTATFSYADGTLVEPWTEEEADAYRAGVETEGAPTWKHDALRREEQFEHVFQGHVVPDDWDGLCGDGEGGEKFNALPSTLLDGGLTADVVAGAFRAGKRFERELPWASVLERSGDEPEYAKPFAVCSFADPDFVDDPEDEEDVADTLWAFTEKLDKLDMQGTQLEMLDGALGVVLHPEINHKLALLDWEGSPAPSSYLPTVDYRTLLVTARFKTDERLGVYGRIATALLETGKTKVLSIPEAVAEYVVPGTVSGVEGDALVRAYGGVFRDDSARLWMAAAMAVAWYGQVRATLDFDARGISVAYGVGTLILGTEGPEGVTQVGTPVTSVEWDFSSGDQRTRWRTGFEEMDFFVS